MLDPCGAIVRVEIALGAVFVLVGAVFLWRSFLIYREAARRGAVIVDLQADALEARLRALSALTDAAERAAEMAPPP